MGAAVSRALAGGIADPGAINAIANSNGICQAAESDTCTSVTYEDLGTAASSFTFVKLSADTALMVTFGLIFYSNTNTAVARLGVNISSVSGGADYDIVPSYPFGATSQQQCVFMARRITGLAAGTYTVQPRWLRVSGTGTLTTDNNGGISIQAVEVQ